MNFAASINSPSIALFDIAENQQGYFTAKQAVTVGYLLGSQAYHVKAGNWVRVERGIYRLDRFPPSTEESLVVYSLWTRDREGEPEGIYSHHTALGIHDLSHLNPDQLHLTVPLTFRRTAKVPGTLILHRAPLEEKDIDRRQGFGVTRPLRAIADLAAAGGVCREFIEQTLSEGRERGLISTEEISALRDGGRLAGWFDELLATSEAGRRQEEPVASDFARKLVEFFHQSRSPVVELDNLSTRQQEVLDMLARGFLCKEIADALRLSVPTVNTYIRRIYERLNVHSRSQAVAKYLQPSPEADFLQRISS